MKKLTYSRIDKNGNLIEFTYSECDKELVEKYKWFLGSRGYIRTTDKLNRGKYKFVHRLITKCPDDKFVDHIDGNPLNNARENLRICTNSQNQMNAKTRIDNKSGTKGVTWYKRTGKWQSYIKINGKRIHLGYFDDLNDAIKIRKESEQKFHKEFAKTKEN